MSKRENGKGRVLLCFEHSLDPARFTQGGHFLRCGERQSSKPTRSVSVPAPALFQPPLKVDGRSDIMTTS